MIQENIPTVMWRKATGEEGESVWECLARASSLRVSFNVIVC
jgi:hypothetical protein